MKKYLFFFLMLFWVNSLIAGVVTEKQALQKAQKFMKGKTFVVAGSRTLSKDKTAEEPSSFYVFNAENQGGFVIVSGDDRTPEILGYADSGEMDMEKLPSNVKTWLDGYDRQIKSLGNRQVQALTSTPRAAIPALIKTQWNQRAPYNLQCPIVNGQHCLTGCLATAIAQIMYYWKTPIAASPPLAAYDAYIYDAAQQDSEVPFNVPALPATTFEWNLMRETYSSSDIDDGAQAVAKLMRYVGQSEKMGYGVDESGANARLGNWLTNFDYNRGLATQISRYNYSLEQWENVIYAELMAKRPILYEGSPLERVGHAFICDGYDGNGRFHINWGWGGYCDGHYLLTVLNPTYDEVARKNLSEENTNLSEGYNHGQTAYIGIQPAEGNEGKTFSVNTQEGVAVQYTITSDKDGNRTCTVGDNQFRVMPPDYYGALTIPDEVTYNGKEYAVTAISQYAFQYFHVSNITLPTTLKSISYQAFFYLSELKSLEIPASVTSIALKAITGCGNLESLSVNSDNMVYTSLLIPNAIVEKATNKIVVGTSLVTKIPNTIKEIGNSAFENCRNLKLTIPKEVKSIGNRAFASCDNSVITVESADPLDIPENVFEYCTNVVLRVPAGSKEAYKNAKGWSAFGDNILEGDEGTEFTSIISGVDMKFTITGSNTVQVGNLAGVWEERAVNRSDIAGKTIVIPEKVTYFNKEYTVTAIGNRAFNNCYAFNMTIPSTVNSIGNEAFYWCSNGILTVPFVKPLRITENVFEGVMQNGFKLKVPAGSKEAYRNATGWSAFGENILEGDEGVEFKTTVSGVEMTFTVTSSSTVKVGYLNGNWDTPAVDRTAAENKQVVIPETVKDVNGKEYTVTALGDFCFNTVNIASLTLPSKLESIGHYAISNNNLLKELVIPASVSSIAPGAFICCSQLSSVTVNAGNDTYSSTVIPGAIYENSSKKIVYGTNKMTTIPSSVKAIGDYAFAGCRNLHIRIPSSVENIGASAFANCWDGCEFTVEWLTPPTITPWVFECADYYNSILIVPVGAKNAYKDRNLTGWNQFKEENILENTSSDIVVGTVLSITGDNIDAWYDLQGRKLEKAPTTKGIYLKNGKKVVVK